MGLSLVVHGRGLGAGRGRAAAGGGPVLGRPRTWFRRAFVKVQAVSHESAPSGGGVVMRDLLFGFSLVAVLAAYAWLYAKNRSKKVGEETSLLSDENPFDPGLEITKF